MFNSCTINYALGLLDLQKKEQIHLKMIVYFLFANPAAVKSEIVRINHRGGINNLPNLSKLRHGCATKIG